MTALPQAQKLSAAALTQNAFENHFRLVTFVLRSLRVSEQDVEELAQETFLRYFRHCEGVNPECTKAWLAKTARHVALDAIAKSKRRKTDVCHDTVSASESNLWNARDAYETTRAQAAEQTMTRLSTFTENPRYGILGEFYLQGQSVKAISAKRGLRVSSVTSALTRQRAAFTKSVSTFL